MKTTNEAFWHPWLQVEINSTFSILLSLDVDADLISVKSNLQSQIKYTLVMDWYCPRMFLVFCKLVLGPLCFECHDAPTFCKYLKSSKRTCLSKILIKQSEACFQYKLEKRSLVWAYEDQSFPKAWSFIFFMFWPKDFWHLNGESTHLSYEMHALGLHSGRQILWIHGGVRKTLLTSRRWVA